MRRSVFLAVAVPLLLNAPSTAHAARCVQLGLHPGGAHGILALRPHAQFTATCPRAITRTPLTFVTVPGLTGTLRSHETRVDGLVGAAQLESGHFEGGGHANVVQLRNRLETTRHENLRVRILLATILIALALFAPRRVVTAAAAAVAAALLLSAAGSTSLVLLGLLTLAGAFLPWRALWVFFAVYLAVLVFSPETQSLALLGPHPWGAGRFYGMSNELETLLLAPALVLGLKAAPLALLTFGWSRAGADGGGILVLLSAYATLMSRPRLALAVAGVLAVLLVLLDAATGGSSHVTHSVLHGGLPHDVWHRFQTSWHGATGTPWRVLVSFICLAVLGWVATRQPRSRLVDAFLVGIAVSLVANDTPQDVLFWGAITGVGLRRAV